MKKLFYLLLLITGFVNGQIVNIPDANFKAKLLEANTTNAIAYSNGNAFKIDANNDGVIQEVEAIVVDSLNVNDSGIADINGINSFLNLKRLRCAFNNITNIQISQLNSLNKIFVYQNQLTNLTISNLPNLEFLYCQNNQLTNLNFLNTNNIKILSCFSNQLTNIDVSNLVYLNNLSCQSNQLTILNCNNNINLTSLNFTSNLIQELYLKNGSNESFNVNSVFFSFSIDTNPVQFICADENEVSTIQEVLNSLGSSAVVNSYCSFNPGGNYNTITGTLTYDANSNGCDTNDAFFPNIKMKMQQWGLDSYTFSNNSGNYKFYTTFADQSVEPIFENPTYFNPSPASAVISFPDTNLTTTQDFCITRNGVHPDLEIVLAPVTPARPGFDAVYNLVIKNKGNQSLSSWTGCLLNYDATKMNFVSASSTITNATAGQLETGYSLNPFETQVIQFIFHINAPTDAVPVNIGDVLTFNATITSSTTDDTPLDNAFTCHQTAVGSFDPNDIACLEGATVSPTEIGNYLHYVVNFENTGNYAAENVVVKIEIDATKFDVASLQLLDSSNPVDARVKGNKVEFIYKNIQLAGPGGHGNILIKIKTKNNLVTGDMVSKNANIYFDYNAPVTTLPFDTTFQTLGLNKPNLDDSIAVFPNPTSNFVTVKSKSTIKSLQLFDVQGRLLQTNFNNQKETKMDISEKANGVYFIKITSEVGVKMERIVKQ